VSNADSQTVVHGSDVAEIARALLKMGKPRIAFPRPADSAICNAG
jgi:hypothetical protein